jgi:hypothetical protein
MCPFRNADIGHVSVLVPDVKLPYSAKGNNRIGT